MVLCAQGLRGRQGGGYGGLVEGRPRRSSDGRAGFTWAREARSEGDLCIIYLNVTMIQCKGGSVRAAVDRVRECGPRAQGRHPGHGFRRHRAGQQGRSLPPPAPPASLSLFRSEGRFFGQLSGLRRRAEQVVQQHRPGELELRPPHPQEELPRPEHGSLRPTDLSCHLCLISFAPFKERRQKYRGARTEVIGKISYMANSAIVLCARYARGDRLELPD